MLDHDARSYELIARVFAGRPERPLAGRHPRQHHALLADQHRGLVGAALLGEQARPSSRRRASTSRSASALPRRDLSGAAELGGAGLSRTSSTTTGCKGGHFAAWEQPQIFSEESGRPSGRCADRGARGVGAAADRGRVPGAGRRDHLAQFRAADPGRASREGGRRPVLHLLLRQLAAHAPLRKGLGERSTGTTGWS